MSKYRSQATFPQASSSTPPQPRQLPTVPLGQVPPERTIGAFRPSIARPPVPVYIPQPIPPQFGRPPRGPSVGPAPGPVPASAPASAPAPLPSTFPPPVAGPPHQPLGPGRNRRHDALGPPPPPPPPKRQRTQYSDINLTRLPEMPIYLTEMPDICKGVSNEANVKVPSEFSNSMKVLPLSSIDHVDIWTTQVEEMAKSCGCYRELSTRFGVFPKPGSVEAFVCQTRYQACWRILHETISGPVWAYMRALGYSKIPVFKGPDGTQWQPAPVDAFYYARQAGHRLLVPGTQMQSRMEVMLMVEELRVGSEDDFPSHKAFTKGHLWMKRILDNLISQGDRQVCDSLYDQRPDWAPAWPEQPGPTEHRWNLGGYPLQANPHALRRNVSAVVAQQNQQARAGQDQQLLAAQQGGQVQTGGYTVMPMPAPPPSPAPPPRSRVPPQTQNQQPFPTPHFHQMQQQPVAYGVSSPQVQQQPQQTPQGPPRGPPQQQQQQQQPPQPAPVQQPDVITIADSPAPSVPPTPPPLFSEEDEEDDENNDGEVEETFHDAEEGADGDVDGDAEDADTNDVEMANVDQTNITTNEVEEAEEVEESEESGGSGDSDEESEEE